MQQAHLTFLAYEGNSIYRVDLPSGPFVDDSVGLYVPGRYVLRVHMDYHSEAAIRSELQWLSALRRDLNAPVPEPVPTPEDNLVIEVAEPGDGLRRKCTMLRWLDGRFLPRQSYCRHAGEWGKLMALFHKHAAGWQLPQGFIRRHRDWDGLFGDSAGFEFPADELWRAVPEKYREPFEEVTRRVRAVLETLGNNSETYGLIHADLAISTNILFRREHPRVIDFDDASFAPWIYDMAIALAQLPRNDDWYRIRDAMLAGYRQVRPLPQTQLQHLDLFIAAFNAELMLWMIDWSKLAPNSSKPQEYIETHARNLHSFVSD